MAGGDDLVDERGPVVRPFLLENGDKDEVQLVEKCAVGLEGLLGARTCEDLLDDEVPNAWHMVSRVTQLRKQRLTYPGTALVAEPSILS